LDIRENMKPTEPLKPGLIGQAAIIVGEEHTAPHVGSGVVPVLATPVMVNLMEAAALAAVERFLPVGYQTLGTVLNVRHFAATPVGLKVTAYAELIAVDERIITFELKAEDEMEPIGEGTHKRVIVNVERFEQRARKKGDLVA
jgi:predicted thioesterase